MKKHVCILSTDRSGTQYLSTSMRSHSHIDGDPAYQRFWVDVDEPCVELIITRQLEDLKSVEFLYSYCFVLMYDEFRRFESCQRRDELMEFLRGCKVIHLQRDNLIDRLVSNLIAKQTGCWHAEEKLDYARVEIDIDFMDRFIKKSMADLLVFRDICKQLDCIDVEYRDIARSRSAIHGFLGVQDEPWSTPIVKSVVTSKRDTIINYDDVEGYMRDNLPEHISWLDLPLTRTSM